MRKGFIKKPELRPCGTIARLFTDQGYGFILSEEAEEVYFNRDSLRDVKFGELQVEFEMGRDKKGQQASRVFLLAGR